MARSRLVRWELRVIWHRHRLGLAMVDDYVRERRIGGWSGGTRRLPHNPLGANSFARRTDLPSPRQMSSSTSAAAGDASSASGPVLIARLVSWVLRSTPALHTTQRPGSRDVTTPRSSAAMPYNTFRRTRLCAGSSTRSPAGRRATLRCEGWQPGFGRYVGHDRCESSSCGLGTLTSSCTTRTGASKNWRAPTGCTRWPSSGRQKCYP